MTPIIVSAINKDKLLNQFIIIGCQSGLIYLFGKINISILIKKDIFHKV